MPTAGAVLAVFQAPLYVLGLRSKDLLLYPGDEAAAGAAFPGRLHRRGSDPCHGTHPHAALGALLRQEVSTAGLHATVQE